MRSQDPHSSRFASQGRLRCESREANAAATSGEQSCGLCGGGTLRRSESQVPMSTGAGDDGITALFPVMRCSVCGSLAVEIAPQQMVSHVAAQPFVHPRGYEFNCEQREPFFRWLIDSYLKGAARDARAKILDFGSGLGHMTRLLAAAGCSATGVEIVDRARAFALEHAPEARFVRDLQSLAGEDGTFDAVLAIDSLYYVISPKQEIAAMCRLLKRGGTMVIRYSNRIWYYCCRRALGRNMASSPFGSARWAFSLRGVVRCLTSCGMTVTRVDYIEHKKKRNGLRSLWYPISGAIAKLTFGLLNFAPGVIVCAVKPKAAT